MKDIYIVISYTGTATAKLIKIYTKNKYAHVSIALDKELEKLYSFGRLNPYMVLPGGFIHEGVDIGTFKRFTKTEAVIYSKKVTDEQYQKMENTIKQIEKDKKKYRFNISGMFLAGVNRKVIHKNTFYCAEFVRHILNEGGVDISNLPDLIKPQDFDKLKGIEIIYEGLLKEYPYRIKKQT